MPVGHAVVAELEGARKRYGGTQALDGLDLALHAGRVTALLGANGAGKSTAVHLLLGLLAADAGTVRVFGRPASSRTEKSPLAAASDKRRMLSRIAIRLALAASIDSCRNARCPGRRGTSRRRSPAAYSLSMPMASTMASRCS